MGYLGRDRLLLFVSFLKSMENLTDWLPRPVVNNPIPSMDLAVKRCLRIPSSEWKDVISSGNDGEFGKLTNGGSTWLKVLLDVMK